MVLFIIDIWLELGEIAYYFIIFFSDLLIYNFNTFIREVVLMKKRNLLIKIPFQFNLLKNDSFLI